ncbi:hypothetical protein K6025_05020 [Ehrlichia sp. JZT12]
MRYKKQEFKFRRKLMKDAENLYWQYFSFITKHPEIYGINCLSEKTLINFIMKVCDVLSEHSEVLTRLNLDCNVMDVIRVLGYDIVFCWCSIKISVNNPGSYEPEFFKGKKDTLISGLNNLEIIHNKLMMVEGDNKEDLYLIMCAVSCIRYFI